MLAAFVPGFGASGNDWDDIERLWQDIIQTSIQPSLPTPAPTSWVSGDLLSADLVYAEPPLALPAIFAAGDDGTVQLAVARPRRRAQSRSRR